MRTLHPAPGGRPAGPPVLPAPAAAPQAVDLWSNFVAGGWSPHDLEQPGLGGSEACLVLWATTLAARGHRVRVYHNSPRPGEHTTKWGVDYLPHGRFRPYEGRDVLVSWKSPHPWAAGARAGRRLHWSSDVERPWPRRALERLDAFVTLTPYHRATMPWLPEALARVVPHGIDRAHLARHRAPRVRGRAIYCSSPDRGLLSLLRDWPRLRLQHPGLTLDVCYGWGRFGAIHRRDPQAAAFRAGVERLLGQAGIRARGQVSRGEIARAFWEAEYWLHPLNRAESELFCLNAVQAAYAGALPVVRRRGALADTVGRWIDYDAFVRGEAAVQAGGPPPVLDWSDVVARYWEPLFEGRPCT